MARDFAFTTGDAPTAEVTRQAALIEAGDAAGSSATTARVAIGDTFTGRLSLRDSDWVAVDLLAGESYVFTAYGSGGGAGVRDTVLSLRDAAGNLIAFNDDAEPNPSQPGAGNLASMVPFTPTVSGTYYLDVRAFGSATGQYTLRTATDVFTIEQVGSQLTDMGWGFANSALRLGITADSTVSVNLTGLTSEGRELARMALETWQAYTGITFQETSRTDSGIIFDDVNPNNGSSAPAAFAGPLDVNQSTGVFNTATVVITTGWLQQFGTTYGSYSHLTYLHEIGHALGLGHGGFYDGNAQYGTDNHYLNDSYQLTIMSYFDVMNNTFVNATNFSPITPMAGDIAGVQYLYGASANVFAGDTVWGANSDIAGYLGAALGVMFDAESRPFWMSPDQTFGFTIVDSGGIDTMDFSRTGASQTIDMREGSISDVYGQIGTVVVALGTVIENAIGGRSSDIIHGNGLGNLITGNGGNDFIQSYSGDDTVFGGAGNDIIYASFGNDRIDGGEGNDEIWVGQGNDIVQGGNGSDTMGGSIGDDLLDGGLGRDTIWGGVGDDQLFGGLDADEVAGAAGNDTIYGGDGNDTVFAAPGDDLVFGDGGDDFIWAGVGNDTVDAGTGNDTIVAGTGNDTLTGDAGADVFIFFGNNGTDRITDFDIAEGDRLHLSRSAWQSSFGTLTAEQVENSFGSLDANGNVVLTLGTSGTSIVLVGFTNLEAIDQYITIIA